MKKLFRFKNLALIVGLLTLGYLYFFVWGAEDELTYITQEVEIGDIEQIVSVNGTVESENRLNLRFRQGGQIASLPFDVGAKVLAGDLLASLDNSDLRIRLDREKASLDLARSNLNQELAGATSEDIKLSEINIQEAELELEASEQDLDDLKKTNQEKIKKAELEVKNAEIALENAEIELENSEGSNVNSEEIALRQLEDAYEDTDNIVIDSIDSIRSSIDRIQLILSGNSPQATIEYKYALTINGTTEKNKLDSSLSTLKSSLSNLQDSYISLPSDAEPEQLENLLNQTESTLDDGQEMLDDAYDLLDRVIFNLNKITNPTDRDEISDLFNNFQSDILNQRTMLTGQINEVEDILQNIENAKLNLESSQIGSSSITDTASGGIAIAKNNLEIAKANLEDIKVNNEVAVNSAEIQIKRKETLLERANADHEKLLSVPRSVDIADDQARVRQADADLRRAENEIQDTYIYSPVSGIITNVNAAVGENVSSSTDIITMITDSLQIKANIPETDVNKVKIGNQVNITFDSLPFDEVFTGKITSVDPAETVIQGVIYYETTLVLDAADNRIKPGMTANLDIITAKAENVIKVPATAVSFSETTVLIGVLENGKRIEREIKIGLESDTEFEIISGLEEGDEIILFEQENE